MEIVNQRERSVGKGIPDSGLLTLQIVYRNQGHALTLAATATLGELRHEISILTSVPENSQKLLASRSREVKNLNPKQHEDETTSEESVKATLMELGLYDNVRLLVLGSTQEQVKEMQKKEFDLAKQRGPRNYHPSLLKDAKLRNTSTPSRTIFHDLSPHPSTPRSSPLYSQILSYLARLSSDAAIRHVCEAHGYTVGTLSELLPHEHPNLLGLNENRGQTIKLRIRTDDAEGFRDYKTTRRVLLHELAHNDIDGHPTEFKILNSELNAQVEAFERAARLGTHHLVNFDDVYIPSGDASTDPQLEKAPDLSGGAYILGSGSSSGGIEASDNSEERRRKILQATTDRLAKLEAEIETGCGVQRIKDV